MANFTMNFQDVFDAFEHLFTAQKILNENGLCDGGLIREGTENLFFEYASRLNDMTENCGEEA